MMNGPRFIRSRLIVIWAIQIAIMVTACTWHFLPTFGLIIALQFCAIGFPRPKLSQSQHGLLLLTIVLALLANWCHAMPILRATLWACAIVPLLWSMLCSVQWQIQLFRSPHAPQPTA